MHGPGLFCMRCWVPGKWDTRSQRSPPQPHRRQSPAPPVARRLPPPPAIAEDMVVSSPLVTAATFSAINLSSAKQVSVIRGPKGSVGFKLRYTPTRLLFTCAHRRLPVHARAEENGGWRSCERAHAHTERTRALEIPRVCMSCMERMTCAGERN